MGSLAALKAAAAPQHSKWPLLLVFLWATFGVIAHTVIAWSWRAAQVSEFERTVEAVAGLAGNRPWAEPWESDPDWQALERKLDVDLVPLADGQEQGLTWLQVPGGNWRASITVPLAQPLTGITHIRGTRLFNDHGIDGIWWGTWSLLNLCVLAAVLVVRHRQRTQLDTERERMLLWHATEQNTTQSSIEPTKSREQFEFLLDHLREGVMGLDAQLRIEVVNRVLCQQLELVTDNIVGRQLLEVVRVPAVIEMVDHCVAHQAAAEQTIEVGSAARYLHVLVVPIPSEEGRPRVLLTATDVSSAQRSELARREFVTGASHELKTPLAAIRAYTETLQTIGQEDPETSERFLGKILDQADRMDRLVSSMLQLARAESGNLKLKVQAIDAVLAIKPCVEAAAGMAEAKAIEFQSLLPAERTLVLADRDALQTIASNLLSNAIRYTPSGGKIVLELCEEQASSQNGTVCLRVSDTGIGIAPADQSRIFERFFRVQKDRAVDSGGTGLGLAIVKQLTQVLSGSVQVISQPGAGTSFEIRLPAVGFTQSSSNAGGQAAVSQR